MHLAGKTDHRLQVPDRVPNVIALGSDVSVVEAIEADPELLEELERRLHSVPCPVHGIGALLPLPLEARAAEHVRSVSHEGVPVGDGEPEMFRHRVSTDAVLTVVVPEGKRIPGIHAFVGNGLLYFRKVSVLHNRLLS